MADLSQRIEELAGELKLLKNEIQQALLDIREHVLTYYQTGAPREGPVASQEQLAEEEKEEAKLAASVNPVVNVEVGGDQVHTKPDAHLHTGSASTENITQQFERPLESRPIERPLESRPISSDPFVGAPTFREMPSFGGVAGGAPAMEAPMGGGGGQNMTAQGGGTPRTVNNNYYDNEGEGNARMARGSGSGGDGLNNEWNMGGMQDMMGGGGMGMGGDMQDMMGDGGMGMGGDMQDMMGGGGMGMGGDMQDMMTMMGMMTGNSGMGGNMNTPQPQAGRRQQQANQNQNQNQNLQLDMPTIAMLARWANNGIRKAGRKRMETILEMYQMTGNLSPQTRNVIIRLMRLADAPEPTGDVPMTATIPIMMQLNTILGNGRQQQNGQNMMNPALLSMMF